MACAEAPRKGDIVNQASKPSPKPNRGGSLKHGHQRSSKELRPNPQLRKHHPPVHLNRHLLSTYQVQGTVRCHKRYRLTIWSLPARSSQSRGRQHSTQLAAATPARAERARRETPRIAQGCFCSGHRGLRAGPLRRQAVGQKGISRGTSVNRENLDRGGWSKHHGKG